MTAKQETESAALETSATQVEEEEPPKSNYVEEMSAAVDPDRVHEASVKKVVAETNNQSNAGCQRAGDGNYEQAKEQFGDQTAQVVEHPDKPTDARIENQDAQLNATTTANKEHPENVVSKSATQGHEHYQDQQNAPVAKEYSAYAFKSELEKNDDEQPTEAIRRFEPAAVPNSRAVKKGELPVYRQGTVRSDVSDKADAVSPTSVEANTEHTSKGQQHRNDRALARGLHHKEQKQRKKRARSFRNSFNNLSLREMRRYSVIVLTNTRESIRQIRELDKKNPWRVRIRRVILTLILGGIIIGCLYWFAVLGNDVPVDEIKSGFNDAFGRKVITPQEIKENDPFTAVGPSEVKPWEANGDGLALEVVNALESKWFPFFNQAIRDWDNGYPDTLTLTTSNSAPEFNCTAIIGKVKVCNDNYGETGWRGLNNQFIVNGFIRSSVARMNEFYTGDPTTDSAEMQYVMCHELGHAWGVPHTDESFDNPDLGNCMDYTNNEENNMQPDMANYQFLYELYDLVPGAQPFTPPTASPTTPKPTTSPPSNSAGGRHRALSAPQKSRPLRLSSNRSQQDSRNNVPVNMETLAQEEEDWLMDPWLEEAIDSALEQYDYEQALQGQTPSQQQSTYGSTSRWRWRLLHRTPFSESHEIELSQGHVVQVHKLLA